MAKKQLDCIELRHHLNLTVSSAFEVSPSRVELRYPQACRQSMTVLGSDLVSLSSLGKHHTSYSVIASAGRVASQSCRFNLLQYKPYKTSDWWTVEYRQGPDVLAFAKMKKSCSMLLRIYLPTVPQLHYCLLLALYQNCQLCVSNQVTQTLEIHAHGNRLPA